MKSIWKYSLLLVFLSILFWVGNGIQASIQPSISINGQLKELSPPAMLKDNRTMVPVRFIIEDDSLQGEVFWDSAQQKVAMNCRGKYIEFFIGQKTARVDGQSKNFDVAPYIHQDRTYIPLRFLAENLGAQVSWNSLYRRANIQFDYRPRVMAYYYYSSGQELKDSIKYCSDIAFRWYECNGQGHLNYEYKDDYASVLEYVRSHKVKTHASVVLMDSNQLHQLLSSSTNRKLLIGNLMDEVKKYGYDGVNIDFEFIKSTDKNNFVTFLRELKTALGPDLELSVAVFARTAKDSWPTGYDYVEIGKTADQVVVMAYDYHYPSSAAGPVAPLWWVGEVVDYMQACMPKEKILLGMPTYGYDWSSGGGAQSITASKLAALKDKYKVSEHFDNESMSPYFTYWDEQGQSHQIWMENQKSLQSKLNTAIEAKVGGISFWRIGNGFYDLYEVLDQSGSGA